MSDREELKIITIRSDLFRFFTWNYWKFRSLYKQLPKGYLDEGEEVVFGEIEIEEGSEIDILINGYDKEI